LEQILNFFIDKPNTEPDELIAIIKNRTGLSLTGSYFVYDQTITLAVAPVTVIEDGTTNLGCCIIEI
jgi:hypothetical protein